MRLKAFLLTALAMAAVSVGDLRAQYTPIPNYVGVGAGLEFRNDINNHLSGVTPIAPRLVSLPLAQLPTEQDGQLYWCSDCNETVPCSSGGRGALALGLDGQWSCSAGASIGSTFPLTADSSAAGHRITNLGANTTVGDALSQGQSHLNDLAAATGNYSLGGNTLTSVAGATATGEPLAYGQSGATLYGANFTNGPVIGVPTATALGQALSWGQNQAQLTANNAAIAVVSTSTGAAGGSPLTINAPASISAGNALLLAFTYQGTSTPTLPTGFTQIRSDSVGTPTYSVLACKTATASEPSSYSISFSGSPSNIFGGIMQVAGTDCSHLDVNAGATSPGNILTFTLPTVTTTQANDYIFAVGSWACGDNPAINLGQLYINPGRIAATGYLQASPGVSAAPVMGPLNPNDCGEAGTNWIGQQVAFTPNSTTQSAPIVGNQNGATLQSLTAQVNKVLNVMAPPYNARGDGNSDDTNAIQSAIYDACGGVPPNFNSGQLTPNSKGAAVYLPGTPNGYLISKPLRIPCGGIHMYGAGQNATKLVHNFVGPSIIAESWADGALTFGPPLVGSTGQSLSTASTVAIDVDRFLNSAYKNFATDAANGFDVEFWAEPTNVASLGTIMGGGVDAPGTGTPMLVVVQNAGGALSATVNTTGGTVQLNTGSCANMANSTAYDIAVDWDRSNYRLFQGGVLCSTVASTNPPVQSPTEEWGFPFYGAHQFWPDGSAPLSSGFSGYLDSVRFERASMHTAAYTPPTAKFTPDGNTDLLLNWDTSLDGTQVGWRSGDSTTPHVYFPLLLNPATNPSPPANTYLHDMELCGYNSALFGYPDGLFAVWATDSKWERLSCSNANYVAFDFFANDYGDIVRDDYAYGGMLSFQHGDAWNQSFSSNEFSDGANYACFETISGGGGGGHDAHQICNDRGALRYGWMYFESIGENDYSFLDTESVASNLQATYLLWNNWAPMTFVSPLPDTYAGAPFFYSQGGGWGPIIIGGMFSTYGQNVPANYDIYFGGTAPSHPATIINTLLPSGVPLTDIPSGVQKIGENNMLNSLELRQAPTLDAGLNHIDVNAIADPSAPSISVVGATGSSSYGPYFVVCHDANGGVTNVSPASNTLTNGPAALSASDYIKISWSAESGCASWDVLKGSLSEALATNIPGTATSLNDTGQTTVAYAAPARNTTGDLAYGSILVSVGMPYAKIPAAVVNGGRFYCTDCDPPANPPAACTHIGAKTGSWVDGVNNQWLCVP